MEMQQMMEFFLNELRADRKTDKEEMEAIRKADKEEIEANRKKDRRFHGKMRRQPRKGGDRPQGIADQIGG
jgi:hypothetical protein